MASAEDESEQKSADEVDVLLTVDDVRAFLQSKLSPVTNAELIEHFRQALKKGRHRETNRQNMPAFINSLAVVSKDDKGGKILTLRREFRVRNMRRRETVRKVSTTEAEAVPVSMSTDTAAITVAEPVSDADADRANNNDCTSTSHVEGDKLIETDNDSKAESKSTEIDDKDEEDVKPLSEDLGLQVTSQGSVSLDDEDATPTEAADKQVPEVSICPVADEVADVSCTSVKAEEVTSAISEDSCKADNDDARKQEDEQAQTADIDDIDGRRQRPLQAAKDVQVTRSVRQLAQQIDQLSDVSPKSASENSTSSPQVPSSGDRFSAFYNARKRIDQGVKPASSRSSHATDEYTTDATALEWIMASAASDYQLMSKLLRTRPSLAGRRDLVTGYNALHWAAKNGQTDVVKLLMGCGDQRPAVDARSTGGGYTALHLAALHARHDVIDQLVAVHKANIDLSDYSGLKAIHHLLNGVGRTGDRMERGFPRSEALLTPRRKKSTLLQPPRSDTSMVQRRQSTTGRTSLAMLMANATTAIVDPWQDDSLKLTPTRTRRQQQQQQAVSPFLLPPREMPAVVQRRPVSSIRDAVPNKSQASSHSDSESKIDEASRNSETSIKAEGSNPDFGTLV